MVFIDTIKYFQQSLATLASAMTDKEKLTIEEECKKLISRDENLPKKINSCTAEDQGGFLSTFLQEKEQFPMK